MEQEELRRKLLGLWEKTTHNSKDLLAILFDYYFDLKYLEYKEIEGKVVSALCGIPYTFGYGENKLKGLYFITLSSEEGYKKKGILSELLQNLNSKVRSEFDFTFIVSHSELLADYFGTQDYLSSFFMLEERFTPLHDFRNDYLLTLTDSDERIRELKKVLLDEIKITENSGYNKFSRDQIIDFIEEIEQKGTSSVNLNHTREDLDYILSQETVLKLKPFISYDSDGNITGIVFSQKEEIKRVRIVATFVADTCSYYALLDFIKKLYPDHSLSVNTHDPKFQTHYLIQQTYASENHSGADLDNTFSSVEIPFNLNKLLQPLGMVRLLRFDRIIEHIAKTHSEASFKLHIRDFYNETNHTISRPENNAEEGKIVFIVRNGRVSREPLENYKHDRTLLNLTKKEISELLLRKNDSSNLIMEAFGIPRLNLQLNLLPC